MFCNLYSRQIVVVLYSKLSPSKEIKSLMNKSQHEVLQNILNNLISIIINKDTPTYIKAKFLKLLELVQSKVNFYLIILLVRFLGKYRKEKLRIYLYIIVDFVLSPNNNKSAM